jgi:hypothetical protein
MQDNANKFCSFYGKGILMGKETHDKLLKISKALRVDAEQLNYNIHLTNLPWHQQWLVCDIYLNDVKKNLEKISEFIKHVQLKEKKFKDENNLGRLAGQVYGEAHRLYLSLRSPESESKYNKHPAHYHDLSARVEQFEKLYNKTVEAKKNEPTSEKSFIEELTPDEILAKTEAVKAKRK